MTPARLALVLGVVLAVFAAGAPRSEAATVTRLEPQGGDPHILTMDIASDRLGTTLTNTVFLPDDYSPSGPALPVVYYLHGTVIPYVNDPSLRPALASSWELNALGPDGGRAQMQLQDFPAMLARAHYIVVAPDTAFNRTVCDVCIWMDGRNGQGLQMESYIYDELIPLVQSTFNARTDRAGRGIMGFSMGGWGALLHGLRHPDRFGVVGGVSPVADATDPILAAAFFEPFGYFRAQGNGFLLTDPVSWQSFSPVYLASNAAGAGEKISISNGDGCVNPLDVVLNAECRAHPPLLNPIFTAGEISLRRDMEANAGSFDAQGARFSYYTSPGVHGANNAMLYRTRYVDAFNAAFARPSVPAPEQFSYRSVDPSFSIWGYDVTISRPNREFASFSRVTSTHLVLRGSGTAHVVTPPEFAAGRTYHVGHQVVVADAEGRLAFDADIGPTSTVDQPATLSGQGEMSFRNQVDVTISPD
jgi:S-formylglutathione hydrolase FrmB